MATNTEVYNIKIASYDRTPKDLAKWKTAMKAAEDPIYPDRSKLMNLYHDIMLDGHLSAVIEKRILNLLNTPIHFQTKGKQNDLITDLIDTEAFENMLRYIIEAKFFGYSLMWVDITQPGVNKPRVKLIDRRHVEPTRHIYKYKESDSLNAGIDYTLPPYPAYTMTAGRADDLGLLLKCAPYVLIKRGNFSDWATFAEIFGMPLRVFKYPQHNPAAKTEMEKVAENTGSAAAIVMSDQNKAEFVENKTTQSGKGVHESLADWCNNEISKIVLGNTMTTDAQGGNYKGEVHQDSEDAIFEADRRGALRILNTQGYDLCQIHGYNPGDGLFSYVESDSIELKDRIDIDKKLNEIVEMEPTYFYEKYGVPVPKGGAKLKEVQPTSQPGQEKNLSEPERRQKRWSFFD
jgi:hypothetical protein